MSSHPFLESCTGIQEQIPENCDATALEQGLDNNDALTDPAGSVLETTPFWKNGRLQNFQEFLDEIDGTRFSTAEDIHQFLRDVEGSKQCPFLDGVVIFVPPANENWKGLAAFHDAFGQLVNRYPAAIKKLVYCVFNHLNGDNYYRKQLANICRLINLESLAIYHGASFESSFITPKTFDIYEESVYRNAPKLKELLIFPFMEDGRSYPVESPLINYLSLIPNLFRSLEYLQFPWKAKDDPDTFRSPNFNVNLSRMSMPMLKKLKIILFEKHFASFPPFFSSEKSPNLEEISLIMDTTNGNMLATSIRHLDRQASSLKSVYLNFHANLHLTPEDRWKSQVFSQFHYDWEVDYPKLKQVSTDFSIFIADYENTRDIFRKKFLQLETLTLSNNLEDVVPFRFRTECQQLWETAPATLKKIRVPHLDLVLKRGDEQLPPNLE